MIRKDGDVRGLAAQLLAPFKFARRQHARDHARQDVEARALPRGQADHERLRLVAMGDAWYQWATRGTNGRRVSQTRAGGDGGDRAAAVSVAALGSALIASANAIAGACLAAALEL